MPISASTSSSEEPNKEGLRKQWILNLAAVFCIVFGVVTILNVAPAGDGTWYWYASLLHSGHKLYSEMHLALQPVYVLETEAFLVLLGRGWLLSKVPAFLHIVAFVVGIRLILRHLQWAAWQKALVLICVFSVPIGFLAYRSDDYHILADCFSIYSVLLLLDLKPGDTLTRQMSIVGALGALSGIAIVNRINDGAAMALATFLSLLVIVSKKRLMSAALFVATAAVSLYAVVLATHDTLHEYAINSIFRAVGSKGGSGSILSYPFLLPWSAILHLRRSRVYDWITIYTLVLCVVWSIALRPRQGPPEKRRLQFGILVALAATLAPIPLYVHLLLSGQFIEVLSASIDLIIFAMSVLSAISLAKWIAKGTNWNKREILLLFPLGGLMAGATSSGGTHAGVYGPIGLWILLLCVIPFAPVIWGWQRRAFLTLTVVLSLTSLVFRAYVPFNWHSYVEKPFFVDRTWYDHPLYGPMYLNREQLEMFRSIQETSKGPDGQPQEILGLPFPYVNYFNGTPPWHGYVQTFFDTSTKQTIDQLMGDLRKDPPDWILYQRQLVNLGGHENLYNKGNPLPHRALDELIVQKVLRGEWHVAQQRDLGEGSTWYLIHTRP